MNKRGSYYVWGKRDGHCLKFLIQSVVKPLTQVSVENLYTLVLKILNQVSRKIP